MHRPKKMDKETKTERSLYLLTAIIPVIRAIMLAGKAIPTVISHHRSSNESILSTSTSTQDVAIVVRNRAFNPTDHLPSVVFGINPLYFSLKKRLAIYRIQGYATRGASFLI